MLAGQPSGLGRSALVCWQVNSLVLVVSSLMLAGQLFGVGGQFCGVGRSALVLVGQLW